MDGRLGLLDQYFPMEFQWLAYSRNFDGTLGFSDQPFPKDVDAYYSFPKEFGWQAWTLRSIFSYGILKISSSFSKGIRMAGVGGLLHQSFPEEFQ